MSEEQKPAKRTDHLFKPGQSGNPKGRPPGATDKHFIRVETWLARYFEDLEDLGTDLRLSKMEWVLEKFFSKISAISSSPEESAARAKTASELIGALEQRPVVGNPSGGFNELPSAGSITPPAPVLPPINTNGSNGATPH